MAIEWSVRPGAKASSLSSEPFNEGDRIVCLLYATDQPGELGRADLLASEVESFQLKGTLLGRWTRVIKSAADEAKEAQRMTVASAESLFFSLFDGEDVELSLEAGADAAQAHDLRAVLQHFLALLLERRRILRALGPRRMEGSQTYRHPKENREFEVPVRDLTPATIGSIQSVIGELV